MGKQRMVEAVCEGCGAVYLVGLNNRRRARWCDACRVTVGVYVRAKRVRRVCGCGAVFWTSEKRPRGRCADCRTAGQRKRLGKGACDGCGFLEACKVEVWRRDGDGDLVGAPLPCEVGSPLYDVWAGREEAPMRFAEMSQSGLLQLVTGPGGGL